MKSRRRVFLGWALVLTAVWVFANWPRDAGALKPFLHRAGFPWTFASWDSGRLERLGPLALAADLAVWAVSVTVIAGLCAWSRRQAATPERRA